MTYFIINFLIALSGTSAACLIIGSQQVPSLHPCKFIGDVCLFLTSMTWFGMLIVGTSWRFGFEGKACAGDIYQNRLTWIQTFAKRKASERIFPIGSGVVEQKEQKLKIAEQSRAETRAHEQAKLYWTISGTCFKVVLIIGYLTLFIALSIVF